MAMTGEREGSGTSRQTKVAVQVGLIVTPALPEETAAELMSDLTALLSERYPDVRWEVTAVRDPLVIPPAELTELVDASRARLLDEDWDLVVTVTDLPLRLSRRPMLTHSSPTHAVALVSLPAHGVRRVARRLLDSISRAIAVLVGDAGEPDEGDRAARGSGRVNRRLVELATDADEDPDLEGASFLARVFTGNVRLILGMIRANRPWRLVGHLSRALLGALAVATFAIVTSDVWRIASTVDGVRLVGLAVASIAVAVFTLISAHGLWEHARDRRTREQVVLFNLVTLVTVTLGIASLYAAVFVVSLAAAALLIDRSLFEETVLRPVHFSSYVSLACLASTLATIGGALGGVLESDAAVREAAYAYRPEDQTNRASRDSNAESPEDIIDDSPR